jgi:trigger factor
MNISRQNIDELNATLTLQLGKDDYEERVLKVLKDYRRKAKIPGFRPGNVPFSLINKMYRKAVLADEINKLVGEKLNEYLKSENISALGDPLPNESENKPIDWDNDTDFKFVFDLGLSPEFELKISKKDKIKVYEIEVEEKMVNNYIDSYTRRYGKYTDSDIVVENELLKGDLAQVDAEGNVVDEGIKAENTSIYLELAKDENEKKAFQGAKVGDVIKFDIKKAFPNDTELANLLKIEKEKVAEIKSTFQFTIKSIMRFEKAELNQDLFNKIYGNDIVKSEEEFKNKITEELATTLKRDSDYKFLIDSREYFLKKLNLKLPAAFLKRWIKFANENKITDEQIEKEFPQFEENMKWQIFKNKIIKQNNFEVKEDKVIEYSKEVTRNQFKQYGINNVPDEQISSYSVNLLKNESEVRKMIDKLLEDMVIDYIRENVTTDINPISSEGFGKLFN